MDVKFDFYGKNFIVTGASSGIGYQVMQELLTAGANVLAIARSMSSTVNIAQDFSGQVITADIDVTDHIILKNEISCFVERFGRIDGVVHCAGLARLVPINAWNLKMGQEIMDVNLWAGLALLKIVAKKKFSSDGASYVYISSVSAHKGEKGMSIYSASKAALESVVRCAAQELAARSYRVNSVCFGWVETNMTKSVDNIQPKALLGVGSPADTAGIILFLLSTRANWITGANFVVDGGYLA